MLEESQKMVDDSAVRLGKAVGELRDLVVRHLHSFPFPSLRNLYPPFPATPNRNPARDIA